MTPVFPGAHLKRPRRFVIEDERLMMEILRGSPALSAFRINKLLARFQAANLPVSNIYAEYAHFADLNDTLTEEEYARLQRLLKYGPSLSSHTPTGTLLLVTPRPRHHLSLGLPKPPISRTTVVLIRSTALNVALRTMLMQPV